MSIAHNRAAVFVAGMVSAVFEAGPSPPIRSDWGFRITEQRHGCYKFTITLLLFVSRALMDFSFMPFHLLVTRTYMYMYMYMKMNSSVVPVDFETKNARLLNVHSTVAVAILL